MAADSIDPFDLPQLLPADAEPPQKEGGQPTTPTPARDKRPAPTPGSGSFGPKPKGGSSAPSF